MSGYSDWSCSSSNKKWISSSEATANLTTRDSVNLSITLVARGSHHNMTVQKGNSGAFMIRKPTKVQYSSLGTSPRTE